MHMAVGAVAEAEALEEGENRAGAEVVMETILEIMKKTIKATTTIEGTPATEGTTVVAIKVLMLTFIFSHLHTLYSTRL